MEYRLNIPLTDEDVTKLKIGDVVYLSGPIFTCRSMLQKKVLDEGMPMTIDTKNKYNVMFQTGVVVGKLPDGVWDMRSIMPTSTIRFEKWTPRTIEQWGIKMILGKTSVGEEGTEALKKFKCVHICPQSVSPNDWLDTLHLDGVDRIEELGLIEATWKFTAKNFGPFVVDADCEGNHLFDQNLETIKGNLKKAYEKLGIDENMKFTKLYGFPDDDRAMYT